VLTGLLTVNIAALMTLIFFVGKNLYRLFVDMHLKVPGYKFRTKLVAIFMTLILIPSLFLFLAASGLATNYFNRIFSPQLREPIDRSVELAVRFTTWQEKGRYFLRVRQLAAQSYQLRGCR